MTNTCYSIPMMLSGYVSHKKKKQKKNKFANKKKQLKTNETNASGEIS